MMHSTKQRLVDAGLRMLLVQGYGSLGIQEVLTETKVPKGSFYHHFKDKEDFALQVVDSYIGAVHEALDVVLHDPQTPPLVRVRNFFDMTRKAYEQDGYLGCLMGGLGQELSGVNEAFRAKIEWCFSSIAVRIAVCLEAAQANGDLDPDLDARALADVLVDCWEGAALRSRLRKSPASLFAMLDFYFRSITPAAARA